MFKFLKRNKKTDIQLARELHRKLKKGWDTNKFTRGGKIIELKEVYPSRSGNLYFIHKNILDLHVVRQIELSKSLQQISFNLDGSSLDKFEKECHEANNRGDQQRVSDLLNDLSIRRKRIIPKECFLNVAMSLIYRHDENPYLYEKSIRDAKMVEINRDPELMSFFLSLGFAEGSHYLKEDNLKDWNARSLQDFLNIWFREQMDKATSST